MNLSHLRPEIWETAALSAAERLPRLKIDRWIGYTRAHEAIAVLEDLIQFEPGKGRPRNMLLVGPTNNGKTMIAEKFRRLHPARCSDDGEHEIIPVLAMQMPAEPSVGRVFQALLVALGIPSGRLGRADLREPLALTLLRRAETRMLVIDELHNLLGATQRHQRDLLNLLRYLGNELRIPIVCLGTKEAYLAIRSDDQLENRFHPFLLPPWTDDGELGRLLASFETTLPLREPSHLGTPEMRELILRRSEGTIGEIAALVLEAAASALLTGRERIDAADLIGTTYQPPSIRRRLVERSVTR